MDKSQFGLSFIDMDTQVVNEAQQIKSVKFVVNWQPRLDTNPKMSTVFFMAYEGLGVKVQ